MGLGDSADVLEKGRICGLLGSQIRGSPAYDLVTIPNELSRLIQLLIYLYMFIYLICIQDCPVCMWSELIFR